MDSKAQTIGDRIGERRAALGLSQEKAAQQLKVSWKTVASWEKGDTDPKGNDLDAVERWLAEGEKA